MRFLSFTLRYMFAMLSAFIICQLSYLIVMISVKIPESDMPGEQLTLIALSSCRDVTITFFLVYSLWFGLLKLLKIKIEERFMLYWIVGIPVGLIIALLQTLTSIWPI